jgi:hypothetical protein
LRCPEGRTRRSMAFYYYTNGRPDSAKPHNTVFRERPNESYKLTLKEILREWTPPAVIKLARRLRAGGR